jgi:hypothetical protein
MVVNIWKIIGGGMRQDSVLDEKQDPDQESGALRSSPVPVLTWVTLCQAPSSLGMLMFVQIT